LDWESINGGWCCVGTGLDFAQVNWGRKPSAGSPSVWCSANEEHFSAGSSVIRTDENHYHKMPIHFDAVCHSDRAFGPLLFSCTCLRSKVKAPFSPANYRLNSHPCIPPIPTKPSRQAEFDHFSINLQNNVDVTMLRKHLIR